MARSGCGFLFLRSLSVCFGVPSMILNAALQLWKRYKLGAPAWATHTGIRSTQIFFSGLFTISFYRASLGFLERRIRRHLSPCRFFSSRILLNSRYGRFHSQPAVE
ncbi:unnamed protein product [Pylaiella littoralis]